MDAWVTILGSFITAGATLLSVWLGRKYLKKKSACDPVVEDTAQSANVYTALQHTMDETGADRTYVLEFHNGGKYFSGRGQQKFSCTHEIASRGISRECNNSQEHRVSNYHNYISELIEGGKFSYTTIENMEDHAFSCLLRDAGVKSIFNVPIKTLNGNIIGVLGVDYVKTPATQNTLGFQGAVGGSHFDDATFELLKAQARIIAGYLV
jgi:hypothetical protein